MPRRMWLLTAGLVVLVLFAGIWQWLASLEAVTPSLVRSTVLRLSALGDEAGTPVILLLVYVVGSLVAFPLSLLVAATGLIFGSAWGFVYALTGTLLAAVVTYVAGWLLGRDTIRRYGGKSLGRISDMLARRGVTTMILISLLPIAPFTLTSMAAGAFHIRFRDYILGTLIGITPGLLVMTIIGSQLASLLGAEDLGPALIAVVVILFGLGALTLLRQHIARRNPRQ